MENPVGMLAMQDYMQEFLEEFKYTVVRKTVGYCAWGHFYMMSRRGAGVRIERADGRNPLGRAAEAGRRRPGGGGRAVESGRQGPAGKAKPEAR